MPTIRSGASGDNVFNEMDAEAAPKPVIVDSSIDILDSSNSDIIKNPLGVENAKDAMNDILIKSDVTSSLVGGSNNVPAPATKNRIDFDKDIESSLTDVFEPKIQKKVKTDDIINKADDMIGQAADDMIGSKADDMIGSKADDMIGEKVHDFMNSKADDMIGSKADDMIGSKADDMIGSKADDMIGEKADDMIGSSKADHIINTADDMIGGGDSNNSNNINQFFSS